MMPPNSSRPFSFHLQHPETEPALAVETERMRQELRAWRPEDFTRRAGAVYTQTSAQEGFLTLELWGAPVRLEMPDLVARSALGDPLPLAIQALLIYYLYTSDGLAPVGEWVSFADLPGGRVYAQAFQGYSGDRLIRSVGENIDRFRQACRSLGGSPVALGDAAFSFNALPRVPLLVTYWQGEDEFPSASKVLFDPTATHHLPIDVCAILGSMLISRILKAYQAGG